MNSTEQVKGSRIRKVKKTVQKVPKKRIFFVVATLFAGAIRCCAPSHGDVFAIAFLLRVVSVR